MVKLQGTFFLGYGFPLFYNMVQFCLMLVFMLIISNSAVMLYNAVNQDCVLKYHKNRAEILADQQGQAHLRNLASTDIDPAKLNACNSFFVLLSKSSNKLPDVDVVIRVVSWIGAAAMLLYFRDSQRKLSNYHRQRNVKVSDFAVIIKNLPKVQGIQKRIKKFFDDKKLFDFQEKIQIEDIILLSNVEHFYKKEKQKKQLIEKKKQLMKDFDNTFSEVEDVDFQMKELNFELQRICDDIIDLQRKDELVSQKVIVIFSKDRTRKQVVQRFRQIQKGQLFDYFDDRAYDVSIKTAPDPMEIIWKNANYPTSKRKFWVALGWILSVLFLASVTVVFFFLIQAKSTMFQESLHENAINPTGQHAWAVVIVYLTILGVQLFNKFLMKIVLHKIGDMQKPETSSQYQFSYAFKYTLGMFFTTALMTLAVQAIRFDNYTHEYGVVEQQSIIFFFNAFFVASLWIIHPQYYIRKIARAFYRGSKEMTQLQANQIMEDYPYDMGKRYAEVLETLWFTYLYASLIPIGPFITFVGLSIYYWIDKFNLLRRSKIQNAIESKLPLNAVTLLQMILIWKPLGDLLFDLQLRGGVVLPSTIVMLALGVVFIFVPWNRIQEFLFFQKFNLKTEEYRTLSYKFIQSYRTLNPVMRYHNLENKIKQANQKINEKRNSQLPAIQTSQLKQYTPIIHPKSGLFKFGAYSNQNGSKTNYQAIRHGSSQVLGNLAEKQQYRDENTSIIQQLKMGWKKKPAQAQSQASRTGLKGGNMHSSIINQPWQTNYLKTDGSQIQIKLKYVDQQEKIE